MQRVILIVALLLGLLVAYVDSRPTWDDTGITVMGLLQAGGIIGLLVKRRPWLAALALGIWVPLWEIPTTGNFGALIALAFAFAGVFAGWLLSRVLRQAIHPA